MVDLRLKSAFLSLFHLLEHSSYFNVVLFVAHCQLLNDHVLLSPLYLPAAPRVVVSILA